MIRHKENAAVARRGAQGCVENSSNASVSQAVPDSEGDPPADQQLAAYIIANHMASLGSAWELALCQSLSRPRGPLNQQQAACLAAIWHRLQAVRS